MLDARGLATYVVTYHQHVLLMALVVAALGTSPFVLFAVRDRSLLERVYLSLSVFVGTALIAHVGLSWLLGHSAIDVEVIRLQATKDDAALLKKDDSKKRVKSPGPVPSQ